MHFFVDKATWVHQAHDTEQLNLFYMMIGLRSYTPWETRHHVLDVHDVKSCHRLTFFTNLTFLFERCGWYTSHLQMIAQCAFSMCNAHVITKTKMSSSPTLILDFRTNSWLISDYDWLLMVAFFLKNVSHILMWDKARDKNCQPQCKIMQLQLP